jgi:NADH-quinone oxidoreductase subunit M
MKGLPILTLLTMAPLIGALLVVGLGTEQKRLARWLSLGISLGVLTLALVLWRKFNSASGELQFGERHLWIPTLGVEYRVGVDGLGC